MNPLSEEISDSIASGKFHEKYKHLNDTPLDQVPLPDDLKAAQREITLLKGKYASLLSFASREISGNTSMFEREMESTASLITKAQAMEA